MRTSNFKIASCLVLFLAGFIIQATAQPTSLTKEEMEYYTSMWTGERFPDGRPKVPDETLRRMRHVSVTEAWQNLNSMRDETNQGPVSFGEYRMPPYTNQYVGDWKQLREGIVVCGRHQLCISCLTVLTSMVLSSSREIRMEGAEDNTPGE
jgi:hypothetical protein